MASTARHWTSYLADFLCDRAPVNPGRVESTFVPMARNAFLDM